MCNLSLPSLAISSLHSNALIISHILAHYVVFVLRTVEANIISNCESRQLENNLFGDNVFTKFKQRFIWPLSY